jgi:hypothetical protein
MLGEREVRLDRAVEGIGVTLAVLDRAAEEFLLVHSGECSARPISRTSLAERALRVPVGSAPPPSRKTLGLSAARL